MVVERCVTASPASVHEGAAQFKLQICLDCLTLNSRPPSALIVAMLFFINLQPTRLQFDIYLIFAP
jgi:hypothetical protein